MGKNKDPKITVLTATYNQGRYIKQTIDSILSQTFKDFEYIIVDDKSTDDTVNIVNSYNDPRIKLIELDKNLGPFGAANVGLKQAKGEYVVRTDADDVSFPNRLEVQSAFLEENEDYELVGSWRIVIDNDGGVTRIVKHTITNERLIANMFFGCSIAHSTVMFRRGFVKSIGNYVGEKRQAQDYELYLKVIANGGKIHNIPQYLVMYRESEGNITSTAPNKQETEARIMLLKYLKEYLSIEIFEEDFAIIRDVFAGKKANMTKEDKLKFLNYFKLLISAFKQKGASQETIQHIKDYTAHRIDGLFGRKLLRKIGKFIFYYIY